MGQQQLLLVILGVIIVGMAIMVGITMFAKNAADQNRDQVWEDLNMICARAQAFYRKPVFLGGGGRDFQRFTLPPSMAHNDNGDYIISSASTDYAIFKGTGTEVGDDGLAPVCVYMKVMVDTMWVDFESGYN